MVCTEADLFNFGHEIYQDGEGGGDLFECVDLEQVLEGIRPTFHEILVSIRSLNGPFASKTDIYQVPTIKRTSYEGMNLYINLNATGKFGFLPDHTC